MVGGLTLAVNERQELSDLLDRVGPDAPTLCGDWTTRDLAAHLVIREGRPDAAMGILLPPLAGYTARVQRGVAQRSWPELVEQVRSGPPRWSLMRLSPAGEKINGVEFFVHHEDVRRARPAWVQRPADPHRANQLWHMLAQLGRLCYRKSPVGVVLRRPDGTQRIARRGDRSVTVVGAPEELMLHAYGRDEAVVDLEGEHADVADLQASQRGF
ncbi:MAG: TIGR03085 family protein [Actinobacteria bacterium]|nr:TIGR03085 family protein [Actinomycetota bacterium]